MGSSVRAAIGVGVLFPAGFLVADSPRRFADEPAPAGDGASGEVLPFPPTPSASTAGVTMEGSTHRKRVEP